MSRSFKVFLFVLVLFLIIPAYSLFKWVIQPKVPLQIMILNKTVPSLERNKHRSFHWVLNHEKYVKQDEKPYSFVNDYFGFVPLKPFRNRQYEIRRISLDEIIVMAESFDAAYYIDTYGVYFNDWYKGLNKDRRSRMIYGGLNNNDYLFMKEMKVRNKLIVAEYNLMGYPTADLERTKVEELLDISWSGWTGKYFESLDTEVNPDFPEWILSLYEKQYGIPWEFHNSGIVLVNYEDQVVVLEHKTHLNFEVPYIYTKKAEREKFGVPYQVNYTNWFDIVSPGKNKVTSTYRIHTNSIGDSLLSRFFIPHEFPAVIESSTNSPFYYFCGDFSDNKVRPFSAYCKNIENMPSRILYSEEASDHRKFFWKFYRPMLTNIMNSYTSE
ncbi:MAG: hypothetical protein QNK30_14500 [Bacteroidales bacterium]|nr:hypothetical protein [Bacteroidales bacterium]